MNLVESLQSLNEGKLPKGAMLVRTTHEGTKIELVGVNHVRFEVSPEHIESLVNTLERICVDPNVTYRMGTENNFVEIPGDKAAKAIQYLKDAKDFGTKLADYKMIF